MAMRISQNIFGNIKNPRFPHWYHFIHKNSIESSMRNHQNSIANKTKIPIRSQRILYLFTKYDSERGVIRSFLIFENIFSLKVSSFMGSID